MPVPVQLTERDIKLIVEQRIRAMRTLPSHAKASLPSAAEPGQIIYVPDEAGGAILAFSDGTNWRRLTDRAVVT